MYPYYALRRGAARSDERRFWFWNSCTSRTPAFGAICIDTAYRALSSWQNRLAVPPAMGIDYLHQRLHLHLGNPVTDPEGRDAQALRQRAGHYHALGRAVRDGA
jgi:hypothetical protein